MSVEAVKVRLTAAEIVASSVQAVFSSCASFSSSESSRMMTLPSSGGPRTTQLRSPKSLWVNSKSREVAAMISSSSKDEDRSITGAFPEPPCSNTGEQGWREEISNEDPGSGGDPDGASGGVLVALGEGLPFAEGEHSRLMPFFPPLVVSRGQEKGTLRQIKEMNARWLSMQDTGGIYSP
jgi:hypothetical protein